MLFLTLAEYLLDDDNDDGLVQVVLAFALNTDDFRFKVVPAAAVCVVEESDPAAEVDGVLLIDEALL